MKCEIFRILLAENSEHDVRAFERCWSQVEAPCRLSVVRDGKECLDYLFRRGVYAEPVKSPRPQLLVSDCEMRNFDGWEVLAAVKASSALQMLPVILMDTSLSEAQVRRAYQLGASGVFFKPSGREALTAFLNRFTAYWAEAQLPQMGEEARRVRAAALQPEQYRL